MVFKLEAYKVVARSNNKRVEVVESRVDMGSYETIKELERTKHKHQIATNKEYNYWIEGVRE